jgi:tripartite ATP-independent transporter DctM subunit
MFAYTRLDAVLLERMAGPAHADVYASAFRLLEACNMLGYLFASLLLPMMVAAGHDRARSAGLIASAGIIAPVIPPSIGFVIFGVAANVSISKLFLAGIVPGVLLGIALAITWWWLVRREKVAPPARASRAEVLKALRESVWALGLPVIILVGLRMGVFTPTEAAVVAAVYALFVAMVVYRELSFRQLVDIFQAAARTSAVVMFLVAAAMVSAWLITVADLPSKIIGMLEPFMGNQTLLLVAIMVLVMIVGTAMDMTPTILILTPVLMPVVKAAGIDPVYFGVLFIINNAIGLITPPVGTVLNVVAGVGRISMSDVTRGVMPFMLAQFIVMFLLVAFPSIVMVPLRWLGG